MGGKQQRYPGVDRINTGFLQLFVLCAFAFTLALALSLASSPSAVAMSLAEQVYDQGMRFYAGRDFARATDYLGQVCDMEADNHVARYYLIYSFAALKNFDKAMKHAQILMQKNPGNEQYQILHDQIRDAVTKVEEEEQESRRTLGGPREVVTGGYQPGRPTDDQPETRSVTDTPTPTVVQPMTQTDVAIRHLDHEEYASATRILEEITAQNPKNSQAHHLLGVAALKQRKLEQAEKYFLLAKNLDPASFQTLFLLGKVLLLREKPAEAETMFSQALAEKNDVYAKLHLAEAKHKLGQWPEAEKLYRAVLEQNPQVIEAQLALADRAIEQGLLNDAAAFINEILTKDPRNTQARYAKAKILFAGDLFDDAAHQIALALQESPDNEYFLVFQARCFLKALQIGKALDTASKLLNLDADNLEARILMTEGLLLEGQIADAEAHLQKATKVAEDPRLFQLAAKIAIKRGDNEEAREQLQKYVMHNSDYGPAYLEFAGFLENTGEQAAAMEVYQTVATRFPDSRFAAQAESRVATIKAATSQSGTTPQTRSGRQLPPTRSRPSPGRVKF